MSPVNAPPPETRVHYRFLRGRTHRRHFHRMLILSFLLAVSLLVFILVAREPLAREESLRVMGQLGHELTAAKELISREQMLQFKLTGRAFSLENVIYEPGQVPPGAPAETIIAYLPVQKFRFLPSGHAVVCRDGHSEWIIPEELGARLQQRERLNQAYYQRGNRTPTSVFIPPTQ